MPGKQEKRPTEAELDRAHTALKNAVRAGRKRRCVERLLEAYINKAGGLFEARGEARGGVAPRGIVPGLVYRPGPR